MILDSVKSIIITITVRVLLKGHISSSTSCKAPDISVSKDCAALVLYICTQINTSCQVPGLSKLSHELKTWRSICKAHERKDPTKV